MKTNITLKLDASLLREIRILAAEEGTSISALLAARLEQIVRERKSYDRSRRRALARLREGTWVGRRPAPATSFTSAEPKSRSKEAMSPVNPKYFVDTDILIYAHDRQAGPKHERARQLIEHLWTTGARCFKHAGSTGALRESSPQNCASAAQRRDQETD